MQINILINLALATGEKITSLYLMARLLCCFKHVMPARAPNKEGIDRKTINPFINKKRKYRYD